MNEKTHIYTEIETERERERESKKEFVCLCVREREREVANECVFSAITISIEDQCLL